MTATEIKFCEAYSNFERCREKFDVCEISIHTLRGLRKRQQRRQKYYMLVSIALWAVSSVIYAYDAHSAGLFMRGLIAATAFFFCCFDWGRYDRRISENMAEMHNINLDISEHLAEMKRQKAQMELEWFCCVD